ncbi:hypothetical protein ACHAWF_012893 [Thalassiosira exigua]
MVKSAAVSTALAAAGALLAAAITPVQAFQSPRPGRSISLSPPPERRRSSDLFRPAEAAPFRPRRAFGHPTGATEGGSAPSRRDAGSFRRATSRRVRRALRAARRSAAVLLASLAFFLSSARVLPPSPAHAASAAATTTSARSWTQRLNPFRTRSADEMIDAYVRERLFADDAYDPVESAYREAWADAGGGGGEGGAASSSTEGAGAYPSVLAEAAASASGSQRSAASLLSSASSGAGGARGASSSVDGGGKGDGVTAVLIKASDFLQKRLRVSASMSYYILAAAGMVGICVLPGMIGVVYQGIQRLQIDKSEMNMYGKISDMDATSKKVTDDDDDDDEE